MLVCRFTHEPEQRLSPGVHDALQTPAVHVAEPPGGVGQAFVQDPHAAGLPAVATHVPLQLEYPASQAMPQVPPAHVAEPFAGEGQAASHAPQCRTSVAVSAHAPPQATRDPEHWLVQVPDEHTWSMAQVWPHPPQFAGSFPRSRHRSPHRAYPAAQVKVQTDEAHLATPFAGASHTALQAPQ